MHFSTPTALLALFASFASAAPLARGLKTHSTSGQEPFGFPLANGFPIINSTVRTTIEEAAGGTLSDAGPPPNPGSDGITNLQLIAFNELFEVAFFTDLLLNITLGTKGYRIEDGVDEFIIAALVAIQAQEELHVLNANGALTAFNVAPIQPCEYIFPVEDFKSAIALAGLFTEIVLGTLQEAQQIFANANASGLVRGIGSVIGQEGEQEGFYRLFQNKLPSSAPFLTTSTRDIAFSALQAFTVPHSCPSLNEIDLKIFGALNVVNSADLKAHNGTAQYSVKPDAHHTITSSSAVVYISGQNLPITVPITNLAEQDGGIVTFDADFPFEGGADGEGSFNQGLSLAIVVSENIKFATAAAAAQVATFGPGTFEIEFQIFDVVEEVEVEIEVN